MSSHREASFLCLVRSRPVLISALFCACYLGCASRGFGNEPYASTLPAESLAFSEWVSQHQVGNSISQLGAGDLESGLRLALLRAAAMRRLMAEDPQTFIRQCIPEQERSV